MFTMTLARTRFDVLYNFTDFSICLSGQCNICISMNLARARFDVRPILYEKIEHGICLQFVSAGNATFTFNNTLRCDHILALQSKKPTQSSQQIYNQHSITPKNHAKTPIKFKVDNHLQVAYMSTLLNVECL